jgi:hypothetical protein
VATAKKIKFIRGDSFFADIRLKSGAAFDVDWTGKWAFVAEPGEVPLVSGTMNVIAGLATLPVRIAPEETELLEAGDYWLVMEITKDLGSGADFRKEIQQPVQVLEQGVPST